MLLKCSSAFGALGAHDDLQLVISSSATISSFGTCSVSTASTRWSERLRPPNDSSTASALPHMSLSRFSLSLSPWMVRGPSTIPTLVGASCEGETVGKIGEEDEISERELVLVISVRCGKDGDMTRG